VIAPKTRLGFLSGFDEACVVKALKRGGRLAYHLELPAHLVKQSGADPCSRLQLDHPDAVHTEGDTEIGRLIDKRTATRKRKKRQPRAARKKQQTEQPADSTTTKFFHLQTVPLEGKCSVRGYDGQSETPITHAVMLNLVIDGLN
jgi:hypothetical protein